MVDTTEPRGDTKNDAVGALTRRRALGRGLGIAAGVTAASASWVQPAIASVTVDLAQTASQPPGQPSIEVVKTVDGASVMRDAFDATYDQLTCSGLITCTNVSDEIVAVNIENVIDTVEYRSGNEWAAAATTEVPPWPLEGETIPAVFNAQLSGNYTVQALVPIDAEEFRNVVQVTVMFRDDKVFLYRQSFSDGSPPVFTKAKRNS